MSAEMSPEEMMAAQKAQCIFCKIINGEIPGKKVYEDEQMLAILDINPANKGHVLVMPKEHYPILPLVPPETFAHLFSTTRQLIAAMRTSLIVPRVSMMVANGAAAGQKSPHFLYHLIPREDGDGLDALDVAELTTPQELPAQLLQVIPQAMAQLAQQQGRTKPAPQAPPQPTPQAPPPAQPPAPQSVPEQQSAPQAAPAPAHTPADAKQQLAAVLQQFPDLRALIMQDPDQVVAYVAKSPELKVLFEGVDIHALGAKLRQQYAQHGKEEHAPTAATPAQDPAQQAPAPSHTQPTDWSAPSPNVTDHGVPQAPTPASTPVSTPAESSTPEKQGPPGAEDVPDASTLDNVKLVAYIESKPKLKQLLLHEPEKLIELKVQNPRIARFFMSEDVDDVAIRFQAALQDHDRVHATKTEVHPPNAQDDAGERAEDEGAVDFNMLARYIDEQHK